MIFEVTYRTPAHAHRTVLFKANDFGEVLAYARSLADPVSIKFDVNHQKKFEGELKKIEEEKILLAKKAK